jgi:negative regulator of sigma E activity
MEEQQEEEPAGTAAPKPWPLLMEWIAAGAEIAAAAAASTDPGANATKKEQAPKTNDADELPLHIDEGSEDEVTKAAESPATQKETTQGKLKLDIGIMPIFQQNLRIFSIGSSSRRRCKGWTASERR